MYVYSAPSKSKFTKLGITIIMFEFYKVGPVFINKNALVVMVEFFRTKQHELFKCQTHIQIHTN